MNDKNYPWIILIPERESIIDMDELSYEDYIAVNKEIRIASKTLKKAYTPHKINIASLGNVVPQLHIHVIGRFKEDKSWPKPVWGNFPPLPYSEEELKKEVIKIKELIEYIDI